MTLMIIVGIAFLIFCVVSVFIITALIQPPAKAVEYYLENRTGKPGGKPSQTASNGKPSGAETAESKSK